jgi:drug/metabolite transporter (DMT)-like permease
MGFAGIVLVIRPEGDVFSWYALLPVCAAFCYASNSVTAPLFEESISTPLLNLYTLAGALIGSAVLVAVSGGLVEVVSVRDWIWLASMGFFGAAGVFFMVSAYRLTEPSNLSPFEYFGIPFSFMLGWLFFAETPFSRLIPGVFLIIGGGFLIIWRERSGKAILN